MSLLSDPTHTTAQIALKRRQLIITKSNALLGAPLQNFNAILTSWKLGMAMVWDDENPSDILAQIGIHAVELFGISSLTAAFLESLKSGCTIDTMEKVKPYTAHPDGSITIN